MRAHGRILAHSARNFRQSLSTPLSSFRLSLLSYRNFQSLAPSRQEAAAVVDESYRPRRFDNTGSRIHPSHDFESKRRTFDRGRNSDRDRNFDRDRRSSSRPRRGGVYGESDIQDSIRQPDRYEVKTYVEDGKTMQLQDDIENLPEYDSEKVNMNEAETEVKEDEITGYKPVRWLEYRGKIDDGFLESMKSVFRYAHLTEVQDTIISRMPLSRDLLVRSKTGTGKTIAFLVPAIQRHIDFMKENQLNMRTYPKTHAGVLIISPTRELAMQIASEARRLVFPVLPSGIKAHCLVGGESKRLQIRLMDRERNDIIVATPGRLLDFLRSEPGVKDLLMSIKTLILDETDSLLDMGFRRDVSEILEELKDTEKDRLTMMFSATISPEVKALAKQSVKNDVEFINTVKKTDLDVHQTINQTYIVHDMGEHLKIVLSLIITEQLKKPNGKVIVFFNTTKQVQLYTLMFRYLRKLYYNPHFQQFEIHSRKAQDTRAKVTQAFRTANVGSVLFTSDVSARGVDYPGVTKIIQVGAPTSRDIYIHRIGRTGRAGKLGDATLILSPFEKPFLDELTDIPIKDHELPASELEVGPKENKVFAVAEKIVPPGMVEETFTSLLGYYLPKAKAWGIPTDRAMSEMENWTLAMGAPTVPQVSAAFLEKIIGKPRNLGRGYRENRDRRGGGGFSRYDREHGRGGSQDGYDGERRRRNFDSSPREDYGQRSRGFEPQRRNSWEGRGRQGSRRY